MISPRGALKLAFTKLRTRKLRLVITVSIASLLFSVLFFALPVAKGVFESIEKFGQEGLGKRYVVQATLPSQGGSIVTSQEVMDHALEIFEAELDQKKAAAKRLNIPFDAEAVEPPVIEIEDQGRFFRYLNPDHPASKAAIKEYLAKHPIIGASDLRKLAEPYGPVAFYESKLLQLNYHDGQLEVLKDGQEGSAGSQTGKQHPLDWFLLSWTSIDDQLLEPFVLPGKSLRVGDDGSIPIIIPFSAAESMLKIEPLAGDASPQEIIDHVQQVRSKAANASFEVCYRNNASASLVAAAASMQREIERNKNKADYQKPSLIYGLPTEACGTVEIVRDVRSDAEKSSAARLAAFDKMFGAEDPVQQKIRFRVVGLSPDKKEVGASNVGQIASSLVNSSLGRGWYMPRSVEGQNPLIAKLLHEDAYGMGYGRDYFVEFASANDARKFINEKGCTIESKMRSTEDDACTEAGKPFYLVAYGSNVLGLENLKQQFNTVLSLVLLGVAIVASLILSNTIGRVIADSRRETAVFRAIGAKRSDIAGIYLTYVTILAAMIAATSTAIGTFLAYVANKAFGPSATAQAIAIYSPQDTSMAFSLFSMDWPKLMLIVLLIFAVGFLATATPLIRNVRRNPIRDMCEEG